MSVILKQGQNKGIFTRSNSFYQAFESTFGTHIGNQTGEEWKWRRQTISPHFKANRFTQKLDIIKDSCQRVIDSIDSAIEHQEPIKVDPLFIELTMGIISYFLLGILISLSFCVEVRGVGVYICLCLFVSLSFVSRFFKK